MKIFLDTNVLVSAVATRGLCADVLREVLTSQQLIISLLILKELRLTLHQKLQVQDELIDEFIGMIQQDAHFATPGRLPDIGIKDEDDVMILSSALNGSADLFVTGDKELLDLGRVEQMEIVSPRMFWEKLKAQASQKK
ncbi:MAG: putative toxin-antitoxin system toxin component, PIN family [Deltaproteobacteria bacterium]|nr:putative toxin-antitoxin system toxin component, PIN family [Deltaproteobacteria bacterium]